MRIQGGQNRSNNIFILIFFSYILLSLGPRGVSRRDQDRDQREAGGGVSDRAPEELQTRDQAGAQTPGQAAV